MSVTSQSTDQPQGQLITDQKALERLFRGDYQKWVADAKGRLGPEAHPAAPRVVSKAFHLAWQDRKRFRSKDELDAFIGAQIHHGASRELSRRAGLHRMESHEGLGGHSKEKHVVHEMNVDEAWDRLEHTLQGGAPEAYQARASISRHEAAEHMKELAKERNWKPMIIVGAIGLAVVLGGMWAIDRAGEDRRINNALAAQNARKYETSYGQLANVTLDDGTIVRLGPETQITVPDRFGTNLRSVRLIGTAQFNVTRPGDRPFDVRNGDVVVAATGTKFTLRGFRDDSALVVHVTEGSVEVRRGEEIRSVATGGNVMVPNEGAMGTASAEMVQESSNWADGNVTIVGNDLRSVLPKLKRWFGLDVLVPDSTLHGRKVFLTAPMESKMEAIKSIEQSAGVKFGYIGENMVFSDTTPSARGTKRR